MSSQEPTEKRRRLSPVGAVKAFFTHDIRLRREGRGLQIALVPRDTAGTPLDTSAAGPAGPGHEQLPMFQALKGLLDAAPNSRGTLRHIAAVERQLRRHGTLELDRLNLPALEVVLRQLDGLVEPPMSPPLAELRAQIVAALNLRRRQLEQAGRQREVDAEAAAAAHMAALHEMLGEELDVEESTPSEFEREAAK